MFDFMKFQSSKTMVNLTLMTFSSSSQMFFSFTHSKKKTLSTRKRLYSIINKTKLIYYYKKDTLCFHHT